VVSSCSGCRNSSTANTASTLTKIGAPLIVIYLMRTSAASAAAGLPAAYQARWSVNRARQAGCSSARSRARRSCSAVHARESVLAVGLIGLCDRSHQLDANVFTLPSTCSPGTPSLRSSASAVLRRGRRDVHRHFVRRPPASGREATFRCSAGGFAYLVALAIVHGSCRA